MLGTAHLLNSCRLDRLGWRLYGRVRDGIGADAFDFDATDAVDFSKEMIGG